MDPSRWQDPDWLDAAHSWIGAELSRLGMSAAGPVEQPHVYPWSTVLRVPTTDGVLWFKANDASLRHEAAVVDLVAARRPDAVPPLLARDLDQGWMLMADAGESLRTVVPREGSLDRWLTVLPLYAGVQLDLQPDVDRLLGVGVPDRRLASLPAQFDELVHRIDVEPRLRRATTQVEELCSALAEHGLPELLQHDDLHDGQVFVRDGRHLLMDWGDACVSHPFFTLSVTLEGVLAWGLDDVEGSVDTTPYLEAYLAPYADRYAGDLVAAARLALRLGWVCRAVNGHVPGDDDQTRTRLRMFLDGRA